MNPPVILVIDDDHSVHEIVEASLLVAGINCIFAYSAEEGIEKALKHQPQLILMDLLMPDGMKGWEGIAALKSNPETQHITTLAFTASTGHYIKQALQAGAAGFISKPFSIAQFQRTIKEYLATPQR